MRMIKVGIIHSQKKLRRKYKKEKITHKTTNNTKSLPDLFVQFQRLLSPGNPVTYIVGSDDLTD